MISNPQTVLQAAEAMMPTLAPLYDSLMKFEECQGWAAMHMLAYREHLSHEDAESLRPLMQDMVERLEFELQDGGYGGAFVRELESSVEMLEETLDLFETV